MSFPDGVKSTPMLEQYFRWKNEYPDCLLFFRMGDFYEMFFTDAEEASRILDIALTSRDPDRSVPMAGVPYHSVAPYLEKLVRAGKKVAICEQMSTPDGKTLVDRRVIRIVTPGTLLAEETDADPRLAALSGRGATLTVAFLHINSGRLETGTFPTAVALSEIDAFNPGEILYDSRVQAGDLPAALRGRLLVPRDPEHFSPRYATRWLKGFFGVPSLSVFGVRDASPETGCACAVLRYLEETQFGAVRHVSALTQFLDSSTLFMDSATLGNLELLPPEKSQESIDEPPSLFSVMNRCRTPMGKRLLREWLVRPLTDLDELQQRRDVVSLLFSDDARLGSLQSLLSACRDVERAIVRLSFNSGGPRDLGALRDTLLVSSDIASLCDCDVLRRRQPDMSELSILGRRLNDALEDELPRSLAQGRLVRNGYSAELDSLRSVNENAEAWLSEYLERERKTVGLPKLKAGYNRVFGYYLEIGKSLDARLPERFERRQTLVNCERYVTAELKEYESRRLQGEEMIRSLEDAIWKDLTGNALEHIAAVQQFGRFIASLDVLCSFAQVARERRYVCPVLTTGRDIRIKGGRHPVVEAAFSEDVFVPNDVTLETDGKRIVILTGPNMAGKSTYLRMAALLCLLAQVGSFIPAESAEIGVLDRIFTRIGARDELARGNSTFMVEMMETAGILNTLSDRSLVILDEIGRGTSTYDGMSIAWAVLEYVHDISGCAPKVLFATHYHELTALTDRFPNMTNACMDVRETEKGIEFLHRVVPGAADRSYGIEVARRAGLPKQVLKRAYELLVSLEKERAHPLPEKSPKKRGEQVNQLPLFDSGRSGILEEIAQIDPDTITPFRALEILYELNGKAKAALESL